MADLPHDASGLASSEPAGIALQQASQPASPDRGKLRVFISYSREDLDFADQLDAALYDFECLIDRHGISGGEDWKRRLGNLISEADTVVFVLSPSSARSEICDWEVEEAARLNKRILPVICRPLERVSPPAILDRGADIITKFWEKMDVDTKKEAVAYFKIGADLGYVDFMNHLGMLFELDGDLAKAREWREKAAAMGDAIAMSRLGYIYEIGDEGVEQNFAKARELFEKAAAQGSEEAKIGLERLAIREVEKAGRYAEALQRKEEFAAKTEAEDIKRYGKPGAWTQVELSEVIWLALLAEEFPKALTVADRAHAFFPDDLAMESNRAHALMFVGRGDEARALYLTHKGKYIFGNMLWERYIALNFARFHAKGLTHPMMADIEKELGVSP